jgi:hypothetical protein
VESDEGFTVTLSNPSAGLVLGASTASGTILNDDAAGSIATTSASRAEGQAGGISYTFTATRTGDTSVAHTAAWALTGSGPNPASAADFVGGVLPSGTVSFAVGETSKSITVNVAGDSAVESDEGFTVTLSNPSAGLELGTSTASGTILNDDAAVSIATTSANRAEGQTGGTTYTFTATRTGDTSVAHTAAWSVSGSGNNAATAGDFVGGVLPGGTVAFAAGETSKTITVEVAGDTSVEVDEGFAVTISDPSAGLVLDNSTAAGTIINDDSPLSISSAAASKAEGNVGSTPFTFTVTRTGDTSTAHTAAWSVSGSGTNAATATDFVGGVMPSGTVSFAAGEASTTITVNVAGDTTVEFDEYFSIGLSDPSNGLPFVVSSAAGRIANEDTIFMSAERQSGNIVGSNGNQFIFGSSTIDSVIFMSTIDNYVIDLGPNVITITSRSTFEGTDTLVDIERLIFSDGILAFDISGNAGQAYRLYQAAFARTPDTAGLKYQTNALDTALNLWQVAGNFIASPEFQGKYGSPSTVTDAQFVTLLYNNVLGRDPDQEGYDYHTTNLAAGVTRAQLLVQFSESPENQTNVLPVICEGIWLG